MIPGQCEASSPESTTTGNMDFRACAKRRIALMNFVNAAN
jgi:hypothetical protein